MSYASPPPSQGYIESILDTDLYKLTMQRAVLETFPEVRVKYRFTNRGSQRFTKKVHEAVLKAVDSESTLSPSLVTRRSRDTSQENRRFDVKLTILMPNR